MLLLTSGNRLLILCFLLLIAVCAMVLALSVGSMQISPRQILAALSQPADSLASQVVLQIRLPRVVTGFLVGGMLALAGALMQVLLRNPLAEPYVLGVSGGASVFALLAMIMGLAGIWVNTAAFAGALLSIMLVFALVRSGGEWNPIRVLLTGVVIASGWGAAISFLLVVSPAAKIHGMLYWLMGDLSFAGYSHWYGLILLAGLIVSLALARSLNLLVRGELVAASLGVSAKRVRYAVYFLASLLTAAAVMQAGSIGFIGLIVPHLIRLLTGSDHRLLLPAAVLLGGSLLVVADMLARTIIAPQQLPVGILTAMIGVPLFLFLIHRTSLRQHT